MFLEIPTTDLNHEDISTALRLPSELIDQEMYPEGFQVRIFSVINLCKVYRSLKSFGGGNVMDGG